MERFASKTIENLKLKEENLLFEQLTKNSLLTVLSKMANSINMGVDKLKLKRSLGKVKFADNLDYDQFNVEGNKIYLSKDLKEQDLKTKVYVLASAYARVLTANKNKSALNKGMEEVLADMVANNLTSKFFYISSKNRYARDYMEFILSLSDEPYKLMAEYFLTNGVNFERELARIAIKNNISLYEIGNLESTNENGRPVIYNTKFYPILNNCDMRTLMNECFNDNNTSLTSVFRFNNLFLEDHLRSRFLNDFSIDSLELFALTAGSTLNLTDDLGEVSNYFGSYPYDFYRIRPFVDEKSFGLNTRSIFKENDLRFNAIVADIKAGKFNDDLKRYTCYYNYHASLSDRLVFLERLALSNGITNGFLLNELLEIMKTRKIEKLNERDQAYRLIYAATTQFLNSKVFNESSRYDAYTPKALKSSLELMDEYYYLEPVGTPFYEQKPVETKKLLHKYVKLSENELKYLIPAYRKSDLLRNPENLSNEELIAIMNDQHVQINRKYFQEVLNSRKYSTPKYR